MYIQKPPTFIQLDAANIMPVIAGYPEKIRDDILWLAGFIRERCNRNLSALSQISGKRGWPVDETTWSRILRGKLFSDEGSPIIKLRNLDSIIAALRQEDALCQMAGKVPFIETTTWHDIKNYIDFKRAPETVCKFGLIIGPTGSQKTACCKQYSIRNNHGACVHFESPETPTMGKFLTKLAKCYGVSEYQTKDTKRERILECINDRSTIIIDNIQRMYKHKRGWDQPIFNYLQQLQDDTSCTIIMVCVPEFEIALSRGIEAGYFEQFEGRVGGRSEFLVLPEFSPADDLLAIAETFHLVDAEKHLKELEGIARRRGRVRILFNALQKAKRDAGDRPLTMKHIRRAINEDPDNN